MKTVLKVAYDRGGYDIIDYRKPPRPPLTGELADWCEQLLKQKQLRCPPPDSRDSFASKEHHP